MWRRFFIFFYFFPIVWGGGVIKLGGSGLENLNDSRIEVRVKAYLYFVNFSDISPSTCHFFSYLFFFSLWVKTSRNNGFETS